MTVLPSATGHREQRLSNIIYTRMHWQQWGARGTSCLLVVSMSHIHLDCVLETQVLYSQQMSQHYTQNKRGVATSMSSSQAMLAVGLLLCPLTADSARPAQLTQSTSKHTQTTHQHALWHAKRPPGSLTSVVHAAHTRSPPPPPQTR
jgi:hypothetical protein